MKDQEITKNIVEEGLLSLRKMMRSWKMKLLIGI